MARPTPAGRALSILPSHSSNFDIYKDYVIWRVVDHYVSAMPSRFLDAKMEYAKAIAGPRTSERWTDCINGMMTALDMPLGLLFVDSHFDQDRKETVSKELPFIRILKLLIYNPLVCMDQQAAIILNGRKYVILSEL